MKFFDLLYLALRNLREAKLRAALTTIGVIIGVAVIVIMVSFGLGLQRNTVQRFKELDLFNEVTVYGKSLNSFAETAMRQANGEDGENETANNTNANANANSNTNQGATANNDRERNERPGQQGNASRLLDDAAIREISQIADVEYVEPQLRLTVYVRANGRARTKSIGGIVVPNPTARFKEFAAGQMISAPDADEIVVDERFAKDFGFDNSQAVVGATLEFLAPQNETGDKGKPETKSAADSPTLFGLPLDGDADGEDENATGSLVAKTFRIVGVVKKKDTSNNSGGFRFGGDAGINIPLAAAKQWHKEHPDEFNSIALALARENGAQITGDDPPYIAATVRVKDTGALKNVSEKIRGLGFSTFSILDQLEQLSIMFLIMNSVLALLGGISLLVASFGIANTMIMSILERTREIGIMKAIGAEDREIKLIFFFEAALLGLFGGAIGCLAAWGVDGLANRLAYRFLLQPQDAPYVDFFALPAWLWLGAILFAILVAIIAALYPAARAARIDPVKALRHD